ncbi:MAG: deoxycytidyl transferase [Sclerophora amabilis]|nr:MAG: deoxycytidyl transferase [Sclerophora amabilis]
MAARLHNSDAKSTAVRKRIENHRFDDENGEEYRGSKFGGFTDYFRRKKIKLQNLDVELRSSASDNPQIFRGVVAHVNGYTQPSLNDLHTMIVTHGGGFMQYLDGKTAVTHIIASGLTPKKRVEFRRYRIVKPAWVVESVKIGRLLPWDRFRVVDEGVGQKVLTLDGGRVDSQANDQQRGYRDQTNTSWYTSQLKPGANNVRDEGDDGPLDSSQIPQQEIPHHHYGTSRSSEENLTLQAGSKLPRASSGLDDEQTNGDMESLPWNDHPVVPVERKSPDEGGTSSKAELDEHTPNEDIASNVEMSSSNPLAPNLQGMSHLSSNSGPTKSVPDSDATDILAPSKTSKRTHSVVSPLPSKKAKLTAEEHNAILLSDPRMWKSSVLNPDFLKQYYSESRLHHLSHWKANLKSEMQQLAKEKSSSQKARQKSTPGARRYVLHVDFDSFFAAVSLKNAPHYKDQSVVVAHGNGSGSEIASCNYRARDFGIKNGMWMKRAQELCPDLKVLPYDFKAYEEASRSFYDAILDTGGVVQSVSVDEALVDVSELCLNAGGTNGKAVREGSIWREQAQADKIAQELRFNIKSKTGCAVSVGIGGNILLAKVALRRAKPAGQHQVKPEDILDFIGNLAVQDLPGVAYSIGGKLEEIGVKLVKDVRDTSKERLISVLGPKTGEKIWEYSRGIDRTEVGEQVVRKSVSAEVNWGVRFETQAQAEEFVHNLCGELHRRLTDQNVRGRQLTMKIMRRAQDAPLDPPKHLGHGKCDVFNKSVVLGVATNAHDILSRESLSILRGHGFSAGELRGLGVQMTKLEALKDHGDGPLDSSQRRLQFKTTPTKIQAQNVEDPIVDEMDNPHNPNAGCPGLADSNTSGQDQDPLVKPLNTLGTQFLIPSQVDPSVLAELPEDIRSKLISAKRSSPAMLRSNYPSKAELRSVSPIARPRQPDLLPSESQLDPEILAALPSDLKEEILATYHDQSILKHNAQSLLPQSPRKARPIINTKNPSINHSHTSKGRTGLFSRSTNPNHDPHCSTLTQANFVSKVPSKSPSPSTEPSLDPGPPTNIAPDFLHALPSEIRQEVLSHQKRLQLEHASNLTMPDTSDWRTTKDETDSEDPPPERRLRLPPRALKPTFTTHQLTALDELREVVQAWYSEFAVDGPYDEDVEALGRYLKRVVEEERDIAKAIGVVKWMAWVVEEGEVSTAEPGGREFTRRSEVPVEGGGITGAKGRWLDALDMCKMAVQEAVKTRGLGAVEF